MRIELPFPPAALFPNRSNGRHWSTRHAARSKARDDATMLAQVQARLTGFTPLDMTYPVTVTFEVTRDNKDVDGMLSASKALIDGVADGIGVNDKRFRPMTLIVKKTTGPQRVVIEVTA